MNGALFIRKAFFEKKVLCFSRASRIAAYWLSLLKLNGEAFALSTFERVRLLAFANVSCHIDISHIYRKKQTRSLKS